MVCESYAVYQKDQPLMRSHKRPILLLENPAWVVDSSTSFVALGPIGIIRTELSAPEKTRVNSLPSRSIRYQKPLSVGRIAKETPQVL